MTAGEGVTILQGDCRETLKTLPAESVHCCVTSPPYWGLRDYGTGTWEGGDPNCDHKGSERYYTMRGASSASSDAFSEAGPENAERLKKARWREEGDCRCGARRVDRQIGLEPTPEAHIAALLQVFREVWRVLRKDGTCWINYGDCYACAPNGRKAADIEGDDRAFRDKPFSTVSPGRGKSGLGRPRQQSLSIDGPNRSPQIGLKPKDLVGMPWRVALALQADGWWLRSDIIWSKRNPMPESVTDRPTRAHEYLFLLAKAERYYYDADAIRENTGREMSLEEYAARTAAGASWQSGGVARYAGQNKHDGGKSHPAGRNRRTVWEINTQPTPEAHFATFPEALVEPCILAGTSDWGCCPECGAPWARVIEASGGAIGKEYHDHQGDATLGQRMRGTCKATTDGTYRRKERGWRPTCSHPYTDIELVPAVVLDPFGGSGTVSRVASRLGRRSLLCELNLEYIDIAHRRTAQRGLEL